MQWFYFRSAIYYEVCTIVVTEGLSMCLVMMIPVDILAVRHVKQGIEAGGSVGHPSNYYLLLSNPNIT